MVYGMLCGLRGAAARKYVIERNSLKTEMQSSRSIIRKSVMEVLSCVRYNSSGLKMGPGSNGYESYSLTTTIILPIQVFH